MTLDRAVLVAAHCWFNVDRVPGDEPMTAFKREARYRQSQWRTARNLPVGSHGNTRKRIETGGMKRVFNGSKLTAHDAEQGANFLSPTIRSAVEARLAHPEQYETLSESRLRQDLLSSMPMCFNLFGEVGADQQRARAVVEHLLPGAQPGPVEVKFEWSPARRSSKYTRDRTAFDVALIVGAEGTPRDFVGIETKYHEHSAKEQNPNSKTAERHHDQTEFLVGVAEDSGVFVEGWQDAVLDTDLRQIWRDHVLALSMLAHQDTWRHGRYLLLYPARNTSFTAVAERYAALLVPGDQTFAAMTIEDSVAHGIAHEPATAEAFAARYLW
jgi:hypothetical protein